MFVEKRAPLLISHRVPGRDPPALAYPTLDVISLRVEARAGSRASSVIARGPAEVRREVELVFDSLAREVLPTPVEIELKVSGARRLGAMTTTALAAHSIIIALERFFEVGFTREERTSILAALLVERGSTHTEALALANAIELDKPVIYSAAEGLLELEGEPVALGGMRRVKLERLKGYPTYLLDYAAKLSARVVAALARLLPKLASGEELSDEDITMLRSSNSLWHVLHGARVPMVNRERVKLTIPSLPGEAVEVEIRRVDGETRSEAGR
ncbi:MAG: hypothetical protein QXU52_01865 [Fervidicoccaceae archaeon]